MCNKKVEKEPAQPIKNDSLVPKKQKGVSQSILVSCPEGQQEIAVRIF